MLDSVKFYKYQVADLDIDLSGDTQEEDDLFLAFKMLLFAEKGHAYYLSNFDEITKAEAAFSLQVSNSAMKYGPIILAYQRDIDDLLSLNATIKKVGTTIDNITFTDEAASDDSLIKENETPDLVNLDLTSDAYISRSQRHEVNTGERIRNQDGTHNLDEELISRDNAAVLIQLKTIQSNITNLLKEWVDYIDRLYLTI